MLGKIEMRILMLGKTELKIFMLFMLGKSELWKQGGVPLASLNG